MTGSCFDPGKRTAEILEKLIAQAGAFTLIPDGRFEGIDFCFGADLEAGHLTPTAETGLQSLDDPFPCLGLARCSPMCGESLLQDALLPLVKRHLIQAGCNPVPKRLYYRKIVESRRWKWHWVGHHRDYTTAFEGVASSNREHIGKSLGSDDVAPGFEMLGRGYGRGGEISECPVSRLVPNRSKAFRENTISTGTSK